MKPALKSPSLAATLLPRDRRQIPQVIQIFCGLSLECVSLCTQSHPLLARMAGAESSSHQQKIYPLVLLMCYSDHLHSKRACRIHAELLYFQKMVL